MQRSALGWWGQGSGLGQVEENEDARGLWSPILTPLQGLCPGMLRAMSPHPSPVSPVSSNDTGRPSKFTRWSLSTPKPSHQLKPLFSAFHSQKTIENERQKLLSEFERLRQFLHDQEHILLGQLEKMEKNIAKRQNENITDLSKEITLLNKLITELEEKIQQPMLEFLKVRPLLGNKASGLRHDPSSSFFNMFLDPVGMFFWINAFFFFPPHL